MESCDHVMRIFGKVLNVDPQTISDATSPANTAQWDSLASLTLMMTVEEAYSIKLSTAEMMRIRNVGQLRAILRQKGATGV